MAGMLVPVLGMTSYNFGNVAGGTSILMDVAQNLDVTQHQGAALLVRVHAVDIGTDAELKVIAYSVLPSPQDPSKVFKLTDERGAATLDATTAAPTLLMAPLSEPLGAFLTITLKASQPGTPVNLSATISVELSLNDGIGGAQ